MSISTHKMLADTSQVNNGRPAYKDSKGAHAKHIFLCDETGTVTTVSDDIGTPVIDATTSTNFEFGDGADAGTLEAVRMGSDTNETMALTTGAWTQPGGSDVVIMLAGNSVEDPSPTKAGAGNDANGFLTFGIGDREGAGNDSLFRVSPYFAVFMHRDGAGDHWTEDLATPFQPDYATRTTGQDYVFAGVKRDSRLEHYADGSFTGQSAPYTERKSALQVAWEDWQPSVAVNVGHSGYRHIVYSTPANGYKDSLGASELENASFLSNGKNQFIGAFNDNNDVADTGRTDEYPQDFYFIYIGVFANGAPPQRAIERAMSWMLIEFKAGNKVISPELLSYT